MANSGNGVGRSNDKVVFVPFTAPGDLVNVKVVADKKRFLVGEVKEFIAFGPDRSTPPCKYFGACGGCQWQHIPYEAQLAWKHKNLEEVFVRIGKNASPPMLPIIASPQSYYYRNRIQVRKNDQGFYYQQQGSHRPVFIDQCLIADVRINQHWAEFLGQSQRQQLTGKVELSCDQESLAINPVTDDNTTELGFRQVNSAIADLLLARIIALAKECNSLKIFDLYCGRGVWTTRLAQEKTDASVTGVDSQLQNIKFAQAQSAAQKLTHLNFINCKVEDYLPQLDLKDSLCIVDPPRAGLHGSLLTALIDNPPENLIYISCHPATQARDVAALVNGGFQLVEVQGYDMFPQTPHLESWTLLRGRSQ